MEHRLKILPCYFDAVSRGDKTFEIRDDRDRGFQRGDVAVLAEWAEDTLTHRFDFTGRELRRAITYVTAFEQKPGFVVFAHAPDGDTNG